MGKGLTWGIETKWRNAAQQQDNAQHGMKRHNVAQRNATQRNATQNDIR